MNKVKFFTTLFFLLISLLSFSQEAAPQAQMADEFRDNGKIYVVITVIALIFISIVGFLIYLERRIKNLENKIKK